ncbi:MAG TPA: PEP-CTERM sorting domain-containing protein [Kiritimatiellia bacterium]|nr:PEP-CTERM sorting domain-containing protein [Kiritimatiellia bacterium]HMP00781.1 PEP-CTERM sorting domain-containing protein [Kiritimatiellia bacterium]
MKKIIASIALTAALAVSASANINLTWFGLDGFVKSDGVTGITESGGTTVAILIWTPVAADYDLLLQPGSHTIGSEVILGPVVLIPDTPDKEFGEVVAQQYVGAFSPGFIYARIFDSGTTGNPNSVTPGLWYYQGPRVAAVNNNTPDAPDLYNMNTGSAGIPEFNTDILNRQVVPEPSTLAFLGLGGLALALRRRMVA